MKRLRTLFVIPSLVFIVTLFLNVPTFAAGTLPPPAGLRAVVSGSSVIKVSWNAVKGAKSYQLLIATSAAGKYSLKATTTARSCTLTALNCSQRYYIKVKAVGSGGAAGKLSSIASACTASGLTAPVNLKVTAVGSSRCNLTWTKVKNASGYSVYRFSQKSNAYVKIASTTAASYSDLALSAGAGCSYKVRAVRGAGEGKFSLAVTRPASPSNPKVTDWDCGSVTLAWDAVPGAAKYTVYRSDTKSGPYQNLCTSYGLSSLIRSLTPGKTYFFKLSTTDNAGQGLLGAAISATTAQAYAPPEALCAQPVSTTSIELFWAPSALAKHYLIYRAPASSDRFEEIGTTEGAGFIDRNLPSNTAFRYKVSTIGQTGEGICSAIVSAATFLSATTVLDAKATDSSHIAIRWAAVPGATKYIVSVRESTDGSTIRRFETKETDYLAVVNSSDREFFLQVEAASSVSTGLPSAAVSVAVPLPPPGGLAQTSFRSISEITLKWNALPGATSYCVYTAPSVSGGWSGPIEVSGNEYTMTNLLPDRTYYFKIAAKGNYQGMSSDPVGMSTATLDEDKATLSAALRKDIEDMTALQIKLNAERTSLSNRGLQFSNAYDAIQTKIDINTTILGSLNALFTEIDSSSTKAQLDDIAGRMNLLVSGKATALPAPDGLVLVSYDFYGIKLTWAAVADADKYTIYESINHDTAITAVSSTQATSITLPCEPDTDYCIYVAAICDGEERFFSEQYQFTIPSLASKKSQIKETIALYRTDIVQEIASINLKILYLDPSNGLYIDFINQLNECNNTLERLGQLYDLVDIAESIEDLDIISEDAKDYYSCLDLE